MNFIRDLFTKKENVTPLERGSRQQKWSHVHDECAGDLPQNLY